MGPAHIEVDPCGNLSTKPEEQIKTATGQEKEKKQTS